MDENKDIGQLISGELDSSPTTRQKYSHDASIFEVAPSAVIYPKNVSDLKALVHYLTTQKKQGKSVSLTARNGGTCMSGGPLTESYVLDMSRHFNHIGSVNTHAKTVWVQGGVMHIDLEKAVHPKGLYFAPYTSSRDICGIGGMIGNNASGERSIKYGATSKNVEKIHVLLSDGNKYEFGPLTAHQVEAKKHQPDFEGEIYRQMTKLIDDNWHLIDHHSPKTKKNAAGYPLWELWDTHRSRFNLARLFIGAQGTLGIVTEAELKLVPFSKATRMIVAPIKDLTQLTPVVKTMLKFNPDVCETFDSHTYDLAKKYHPEDANRASFAENQHMVVFGIYAGDTQRHADTYAGQAKEALEKSGFSVNWIDDQAVVESTLLIRRKSFRMLLEHPTANQRAMAFLEDTIVPLEHYAEFLASLEAILAEYDMTYTYAGHIGDGSIRLVPLVDMDKANAPEKVMELETRVNDLVLAFGGSISVDHNDGIIRTPYLSQMFGPEMVELFAKVKNLFDPLNIFNPGKKVGGTLDYAQSHIRRGNK